MPAVREEERQKSYQPEKWAPKHEMVARLHGSGLFTNNQIAELVGLTPARVSILINDARAKPAVEDSLEAHKEVIESLHGRLTAGAGKALDVIEDQIVDFELDPRIRQKASFGWLDRAGYTPVQKQIVLGGNIPADALAGVVEALRASENVEIQYVVPPTAPVPSTRGKPKSESAIPKRQDPNA